MPVDTIYYDLVRTDAFECIPGVLIVVVARSTARRERHRSQEGLPEAGYQGAYTASNVAYIEDAHTAA